MLDPWIIEEIRRREEEQSQRDQRVRIELPLEGPSERDRGGRGETGGRPASTDRGVTIIDYSI